MKTYKEVTLKIVEILGYTTIAIGFTMTILLLSTVLTNATH